ncbi:MAG: hypothetical protein KatS3mg111_0257 [Pirellulaceae bacterium]|nr:MAG: hypothetical protein KatS3mg111_0257 [Pirellulaceae bacterium]
MTMQNNVKNTAMLWFAKQFVCSLVLISVGGCGSSNEAILPSTELTAEQVEAMKQEDAAVEEEESGNRR